MSNRATQEHLGGSIGTGSISGAYKMRQPTGVNGARAYLFDFTATSNVVLPDATDLPVGTDIWIASEPGSAVTANVDDYDGTTIGTLAAGYRATLTLLESGTSAGVWAIGSSTIDIAGAPSGGGGGGGGSALSYELTISTPTGNFNLYDELIATYGYDGTTPANVTVHVNTVMAGAAGLPGFSVGFGFWSGALPVGSTLLLDMMPGAYITGRGGVGGRGADIPLVTNSTGGDGGIGLSTRVDTVVTGTGTIQGGGGGGGGGISVQGQPGSGGGGGAGWFPAQGGSAGTADPYVFANTGYPGNLTSGGSGGLSIGGPVFAATGGGGGGGPGTVGNTSFGYILGGSPGNAVSYLTGTTFDSSSFAGTITGAVVAV